MRVLFLKAQVRGARATTADMFSELLDRYVEHKGYVRPDGAYVPPHRQKHKTLPREKAQPPRAAEKPAQTEEDRQWEAASRKAKQAVGARDGTVRGLIGHATSVTVGTVRHGEDAYRISFSLHSQGRASIRLKPKGDKAFTVVTIADTHKLSDAMAVLMARLQPDAELQMDGVGDKAGMPAKNPKARRAVHTGNPEDDAKLLYYRKRLAERKRRGLSGLGMASDEKMLEILEARAAADPAKWGTGNGVGYRVAGQVNRGFRVVQISSDDKMALVRQVADTGLTTSGGNHDRMGERWVHIADLVRDRKYDKG